MEGREFISVEVDTRVMEGGIIEGNRESSEETVMNDEVVPPIVVEMNTNITQKQG